MAVATLPRTSELVELLDDEIRIYDDLLAVARGERDAILGSDPAVLDGLVSEKERLIAQIARVEARRQAWVGDWAASVGADQGSSLAAVIGHSSPDEATPLTVRRELLLARVRELGEIGFRNKHLLTSALGVVSRRLDAYNRVSTAVSYRASGQTVQNTTMAQLDFKA